jgi:hypothetical protein
MPRAPAGLQRGYRLGGQADVDTAKEEAMVIHIVRFRSTLSDERIGELFQARAPEYLAVPGLLQKYYLRFRSGEHGGVYVWDCAASMERFMAGELAHSICDVYRVKESVRDVADVVLTLRGEDWAAFLAEPPSSAPVTAGYEADNDAVGARPDPQLGERAPKLVRDAVTFGRLPSPDA